MSIVPLSSSEVVAVEEDSFMTDLMNLMKTEEFKRFQKKHMTNSVESKSSHVYFELYRAISQIYQEIMGEEIPDEMSRAILQSIMRRGNYRKPLITTVLNYLEGSNKQDVLCEKIKDLLIGADQLLSLDQ